VLGFDHQTSDICDVCSGLDCDDLKPRPHDLSDSSVAKLDNGLDKLTFRFFYDTCLFSDVDKSLYLFLCLVFFVFSYIFHRLRFPHPIKEQYDWSDHYRRKAIKNLKHRKERPEHVLGMILSDKARNKLSEENYYNKNRDEAQEQRSPDSGINKDIG
jgi:hypothetical protein